MQTVQCRVVVSCVVIVNHGPHKLSVGADPRQGYCVCGVVVDVRTESHANVVVAESVVVVFSQNLDSGVGADTTDVDDGVLDGYASPWWRSRVY